MWFHSINILFKIWEHLYWTFFDMFLKLLSPIVKEKLWWHFSSFFGQDFTAVGVLSLPQRYYWMCGDNIQASTTNICNFSQKKKQTGSTKLLGYDKNHSSYNMTNVLRDTSCRTDFRENVQAIIKKTHTLQTSWKKISIKNRFACLYLCLFVCQVFVKCKRFETCLSCIPWYVFYQRMD